MLESKIAWTHSTFNPWWGCFKVSPECKHCYAEAFAKRTGNESWGHLRRRFFGEKHWNEPLKWNARALVHGQPHRVFCASMADIFEELPKGHADEQRVADERQHLFELIRHTPALTWLLLTKRPENITRLWPRHDSSLGQLPFPGDMPPPGAAWPNVWLGTSVGVRETKWRIDELRKVPATVHFISAEPQIEDIGELDLRDIEWLISGGESGPKARPFDLNWAFDLQRQCAASGTAFFMKQLGEHAFIGDAAPESSRGPWQTKQKKGDDIAEFPQSLQVRELPEARR